MNIIKKAILKAKYKKQYIKNNTCCINNEYKKINTNMYNIDIGYMPICKTCYIDISGI